MLANTKLTRLAFTIAVLIAAGASTAGALYQLQDRASDPRPVFRFSNATFVEPEIGGPIDAFTDAREGLTPLPPTDGELAKLELARQAQDEADAAGTRWIVPSDITPEPFDASVFEEKMARRNQMEPQNRSIAPGIPAGEEGATR